MNLPQSGVLPEVNSHAVFISLDLAPGDEALERAKQVLGQTPTLTETLAGQYPEAKPVSVVAVGPGIWASLFGNSQPLELAGFQPRTLGHRKAPATPADLLVYIRCERRDLVFELARRVLAPGREYLRVREETNGFRYLDTRDLTGFVDGSQNPKGDERAEVALVGNEDPEFAGGSYVMLQRYVHDLDRWNTLDQAEQERVIGRTRDTDKELDDDIKPDTAHISRVEIEEDGHELKIVRQSMPWGDSQRAGLMFIAFSRHRNHFDKMLDSMFDVDHSGVHDRLMDFTTAETGAYFFAPSLHQLSRLSGGDG